MAQRCDNCLNHVLGEIAIVVKMRHSRSRTKRPREALLQLDIDIFLHMFSIGGTLRGPVRYHPYAVIYLTTLHESGERDSIWWVV
jgi:hypothetical protein